MHNLYDTRNELDQNILASSELIGRECCCCFRILDLKHFRRDSSNRDGRAERCVECESTPWLSIAENTARLKEQNYNSDAHKRQRPEYMASMRCDIGRVGKVMDANDFLAKLKTLVPGIIWVNGAFEEDFAVFLEDSSKELGYRYLWYLPKGYLPEYSIHEFDQYDCPVKEKRRGWRTALLRCILGNLVSEKQAHETFGYPTEGLASEVYRVKLYDHRNKK
jgi:hypothetical protein